MTLSSTLAPHTPLFEGKQIRSNGIFTNVIIWFGKRQGIVSELKYLATVQHLKLTHGTVLRLEWNDSDLRAEGEILLVKNNQA